MQATANQSTTGQNDASGPPPLGVEGEHEENLLQPIGTRDGASLQGSEGVGGVFQCIVADPPWDVKRIDTPGSASFGTQSGVLRSKPLPYPTMSVWEIAAMKVPAAKHAHLYMWTINSYVEAAYMIARAWGFEPACLLSWVKSPMGLGHGGTFCNTTEFILFARRGNLKAKRRVDRTWFGWPRGEHSQKPEEFQTIVESVSPGPYLEIFARRKRHGWLSFGNEVTSDVRIVTGGGGGFETVETEPCVPRGQSVGLLNLEPSTPSGAGSADRGISHDRTKPDR